MRFEWDSKKAEINAARHGISFGDASLAFYDPLAIRLPDIKHSTQHEKREILIGQITAEIFLVVYTIRQANAQIRIISARRANHKERRIYETKET